MVAKQVIAIAVLWFVGTIALLALSQPAEADCGHFFRKQVVYQKQYYAPAYVAPIVYAAPVYYSAGIDYQIEAAVEKALRLREQAPSKGYQSPQQAPIQAPIQAPVQAPIQKGGLEPLQQVATGVFSKCSRCHTGEKPAGGLVLDGTSPIDAHAYFRFGQIAGQGKDVPAKMQALIASMTPEQKGEINDALLNLVAAPVQPEPPADRPPPAPVPEDGGLQ